MQLKSTYNFVPAPKESEVFYPGWAEKISQDIPFSDGESGEIELKLTTQTPIFIRNGCSKEKEDIEFSHFFDSKGIKKYFIPATSLKGMFRNVLEIISASKLNRELVNDNRYSFRDLTRGSLYMQTYKSSDVKGGWLRENKDGSWVIKECSHIYHIHHSEVDNALGTNFRKLFLNRNPKDKTAKFKYEDVAKGKDRVIKFNVLVSEDDNFKEKAIYDKNGSLTGTIVFTGQSGKRKEELGKKPSGKVHEFTFTNNYINTIEISEKQKKDFKFIYLDHDSQNISPDWKYWRKKLKDGEEIPVFFNKADENSVKHFGLAFMYKLPYMHSVHEMHPIKDYSNKMDLSESIFGKIDKNNSIKGRVFIGNAISENAVPDTFIQKEIFAGPKASYFPFYLEQGGVDKNGYSTYENDGALKGYKRYPVHNASGKGNYSEKQLENVKVFSKFIPLKKGAEFLMKLRFHNLRKVEIGALISAITFHDNLERCYHSLGGGKPYGYGKIKISGVTFRYLDGSMEDYLQSFESEIGTSKLRDTLTELIAMSSNEKDRDLVYPILDADTRTDEFKDYKNSKVWLPPFSSLNPVKIQSVAEKVEKQRKKKMEEQQQKLKEKAEEERITWAQRLSNSSDKKELLLYIEKYPNSSEVSGFRERIEELSTLRKKQEANTLVSIPLEFESNVFDDTKNYLNPFLRNNKHFEFSDDQKNQIMNQIKFCWKEDNSAFYKKNKIIKFPKFPWSDIKRWVGAKDAQTLFDELTREIKTRLK